MTIDLKGRKIGRLTVLNYTNERSQSSIMWNCSCRCGNTVLIASRDLLHGVNRKGCGKCNDTNHPLYRTWIGIKERCFNSTNPAYKDYGGRGITVSKEWLEDFLNFVEDMGPRPALHSVERIDNDGNYCKENCKWATAAEQVCNQRTAVTKLTDQDLVDIYHANRDLPSKILADAYGVSSKTILNIRCKQHGRERMELALKKYTPRSVSLSK